MLVSKWLRCVEDGVCFVENGFCFVEDGVCLVGDDNSLVGDGMCFAEGEASFIGD